MVFTQLLANSLIAGSIYALVAVGFSLIYATTKIMHFAHGAAVVIGAYIVYTLFTLWGLNFWVAAVLTVILSALLGYFMFRLLYVPLKKKKASNVILLIASIGLLILFENIVLLVYGADVKTIGFIQVAQGLPIAGAVVTKLQIVIFIVSLILCGALYWLMQKTRLGRNMRAVVDNEELASITGINPRKIQTAAFMIGTALAGVAGVLVGLEQNLEPSLGIALIIKGFTGAIIGGITSVPAAVAGSFILGIAENFGIWYLPSGYKDAIAFVLLFIFLLWRPTGLFGLNKGVKDA